MKTLYLKIDDLQGFIGDKRPIESQIKVMKKDLTFYRIKDDVPENQRFEVRVPDDVDLKKKTAYTLSTLSVGLTIANRKGVISFDAFKEQPQDYLKPLGLQDKLFDAMTRRQIGIIRYGKTLSEKIKRVLKDSDSSIQDILLSKFYDWNGVNNKKDKEKLDAVLSSVSENRNNAWVLIFALFKSDLKDLAVSERESFYKSLATVLPFTIPGVKVSTPDENGVSDITVTATRTGFTAKEAENLVDVVTFKGKDLNTFLDQSKVNDISRLADAVTTGAVIGETAKEISNRIVGDPILDGAGGVTKITVDDMNGLTTSSTNLVTNAIRDDIIQKEDVFDKMVFVAVLDSRTTPICRSLDGKVFDKTKSRGYKPPLHVGCRSQLIPLVNIDKASRRGLNLQTEQVYVREFLNSDTAETRSDVPRGQKKEYDKWLKERLKKDMGTLNIDITYNDWLKRQPLYFQEFVLGKTKAQLFRRGDLTLDKFVNPDGSSITLESLAKTEKQSFIDAGLDPSKY
jgi:SPP1 gp7 family putative phage head morphogenesis protein